MSWTKQNIVKDLSETKITHKREYVEQVPDIKSLIEHKEVKVLS